MLQTADEAVNKIVKLLVDTFSPERIYLFGSRAREDSTADSDYDFLMVVSEAIEPRYRLAQRAHSLLWDLAVAADILVWTAQDFDSRLHLKASLPSTVVREGRLLYANSDALASRLTLRLPPCAAKQKS